MLWLDCVIPDNNDSFFCTQPCPLPVSGGQVPMRTSGVDSGLFFNDIVCAPVVCNHSVECAARCMSCFMLWSFTLCMCLVAAAALVVLLILPGQVSGQSPASGGGASGG